jgi:hypothetical protein
MPGFLTDYANNIVLDGFFGSVSYSPPSTLYFGLSQSAASKAGTVIEPAAGNYSRVSVTNNLSSFSVAQSGTKTNAISLVFPTPSQAWGTIESVFVSDSAIGGHVLAIADLPSPSVIAANTGAPSIAIGALFISHT